MKRSTLGYLLVGSVGALVLGIVAVNETDRLSGPSEECRKALTTKLYREAVTFEGQKNLGAAAVRFSGLCDGGYYWSTQPQESPCDASARLSRQLSKAYEATMAALTDHFARNGQYPVSLSEILPALPAEMREVVAHFVYCRKKNPTDRTGDCSDGSISFSDGAVAIGTGQYGSVSFSLESRSRNASMPAQCAGD